MTLVFLMMVFKLFLGFGHDQYPDRRVDIPLFM